MEGQQPPFVLLWLGQPQEHSRSTVVRGSTDLGIVLKGGLAVDGSGTPKVLGGVRQSDRVNPMQVSSE